MASSPIGRSTSSTTAVSASSSPNTRLPFTLMVIADLLGVPDEDRDEIRAKLAGKERPMAKFRASLVQEGAAELTHKPLEFLYERFTALHRGPSARRRATTS